MSDEPVKKILTEDEKAAVREAKNARREAKRASLSPEAEAAALLRRQRLAEREAAKKERLKQKKRKSSEEGSSAASDLNSTSNPKKKKKTLSGEDASVHGDDNEGGVVGESNGEKADKKKKKKAEKEKKKKKKQNKSGGEEEEEEEEEKVDSASPLAAVGGPVKKLTAQQGTAAAVSSPHHHQVKAAAAYSAPQPTAFSRAKQLEAAMAMNIEPPYEVFLKYLPHDATEAGVLDFFQGCGEVEFPGPKLMRDNSTGRVIRGFVTFTSAHACRQALARNLERMGKRSVSVTKATTTGTLQAEGTHTPAMFAECVKALGVSKFPSGVFVDGTFGRGGHTRKILEALGPSGELHAFDMDEEAIEVGQQLEQEDHRFHIHHAPFSSMHSVLTEWKQQQETGQTDQTQGKKKAKKDPTKDQTTHKSTVSASSSTQTSLIEGFVHGVLIDIGISSPQLDGLRGFRPEFDCPLDMRFDVRPEVETALQYLRRAGRLELATNIERYGGEHPLAARRIADAVDLAKRQGKLEGDGMRTSTFAALVVEAKGKEYQAMHPAKMTFQALRIVVNKEYFELAAGLEASMKLLRDGGRTAILTWKHSECAIVVDHSRRFEVAMSDAPLRVWYEENQQRNNGGSASTFFDEEDNSDEEDGDEGGKAKKGSGGGGSKGGPAVPFKQLAKKVGVAVEDAKRPTAEEVKKNSRSRSAVLHLLRRETGVLMTDLESAAAPLLGWDSYPPATPLYCEGK